MWRVMFFRFICTCGVLVTPFVHALSGPDLLHPGEVSVTAGDGRGVVVVFLSALCPCSRAHVGVIKKLASDFKDFRFVGVHSNGDEKSDDARGYFSALKLIFPIIEDRGHVLADRFEASRTPHAFVLRPNDEIVYRGGVSDSHDGARAREFPLRAALEDLRAGRAVRRADARALGCTIARSSDAP